MTNSFKHFNDCQLWIFVLPRCPFSGATSHQKNVCCKTSIKHFSQTENTLKYYFIYEILFSKLFNKRCNDVVEHENFLFSVLVSRTFALFVICFCNNVWGENNSIVLWFTINRHARKLFCFYCIMLNIFPWISEALKMFNNYKLLRIIIYIAIEILYGVQFQRKKNTDNDQQCELMWKFTNHLTLQIEVLVYRNRMKSVSDE